MDIHHALRCLDGVSVGDAFGERFFIPDALSRIRARQIPDGIWRWTDDTHMALSIVETLNQYQRIDQDFLMQRFSTRYVQDQRRGYGEATRQLLERTYSGEDWRIIHTQIIEGGSYGNGAAMRAAPIGAYYRGDPERTADEARLSAQVTHAHPEGIAGAVAVAVAASIASQTTHPIGVDYLRAVLEYVPSGLTKDGISRSVDISPELKTVQVAQVLGNGSNASAQDTVPFCLWCAAYHLDHFEEALWTTVSGLGDRDTTCAIVGGIVSLSSKEIPPGWIQRREPLPKNFMVSHL